MAESSSEKDKEPFGSDAVYQRFIQKGGKGAEYAPEMIKLLEVYERLNASKGNKLVVVTG